MNQRSIPIIISKNTNSHWQLNLIRCNFGKNVPGFVVSVFFYFPPFLLLVLLLLFLAYNNASVFSIRSPFPSNSLPEQQSFSPENAFPRWVTSIFPFPLAVPAIKPEVTPETSKPQLPLMQRPQFSVFPANISSSLKLQWPKRRRPRKNWKALKVLWHSPLSKQFPARVREFLNLSSTNSSSISSCKLLFFMTWISSLDLFGERELLTIESLFKSHPSACLIIVSNSMDSIEGTKLLRPFVDLGFRVIAISPDFDYIFKSTTAETWFERFKKGRIDPGKVSLGQNLSNLLRLALLYKYGGIYIDTDLLVLKSLSQLRNVIGAQTVDAYTKNWTRLNNAVMIFDKQHPLLFKFIEEFTRTYNGRKWGHNGPYLVSRVVLRVTGKPGFNFTVLPPSAFYPVGWIRIKNFFRAPRDEKHSKWLHAKVDYLRRHSFALHLWNKESRMLKVEEGSLIRHITLGCCIVCNFSLSKS